LDASTIDKDVDTASHGIQSPLKYALYGIEVVQIAVNNLCSGTQFPDGIDGVKVWWRFALRLTKDEANRCTGLGKSNCAGCTDTLIGVDIEVHE
jgi:hypothetical protein